MNNIAERTDAGDRAGITVFCGMNWFQPARQLIRGVSRWSKAMCHASNFRLRDRPNADGFGSGLRRVDAQTRSRGAIPASMQCAGDWSFAKKSSTSIAVT
jgi:hypothetical protein